MKITTICRKQIKMNLFDSIANVKYFYYTGKIDNIVMATLILTAVRLNLD